MQSRSPWLYQCLGLSLPFLAELGLEQLAQRLLSSLWCQGGFSVLHTVLAQIILLISKPAAVETVRRNCQPPCKSRYAFYSSSNAGLLINNGHAYRTLEVGEKEKTRTGVLFTLHVVSLGISNCVGRRAGLCVTCSSL